MIKGGENLLQNAVAKTVLYRIPMYLEYLMDIHENEPTISHISSKKISTDLELGEVQVRKDLSMVCDKGKPKIGYNLLELITHLQNYLGCNHTKYAIVIGVGKLGSAIYHYEGFKKYGIEIVAGYDKKDNECIPDIQIFSKENVMKIFQTHKIEIGIICVPKEEAQEVADILVALGVKAIWNFAPVRLKVPKSIFVQNENLAYSLSIISSIINHSQ